FWRGRAATGLTVTARGVMLRQCCYLLLAAIVTGCAAQHGKSPQSVRTEKAPAAVNSSVNATGPLAAQSFYPSTYQVPPTSPTLIRHATVLTGTGTRLDGADVLLVDGKIQAVGPALQAPHNSKSVEGNGLWVTPGIIDVHSHLGDYPS